MAFVEKTERQLLLMSEEEQAKYWQEFQEYYKEKRKNIRQKMKEKESLEKQKNRKRRSHALYVYAGESIKDKEYAIALIKKISESETVSKKTKEDLMLLLDEVKNKK
jgi:hypothetical protein